MEFGSLGRSAPAGTGTLELDWEMFGELCRALAMKIANSGFHPEIVIGIAKAGVIPGAVIASIMRCDFHSMKISRREGQELVRETPMILSEVPRQAAGKRVLVVDEIATSGDTLRTAINALRNVRPGEVRTAVSFLKAGGFRPDYYALETDALVVFPWDRQVLGDDGDIVVNPMYSDIL